MSKFEFAKKYLRGEGLEIGALHAPLSVSSRTRVVYVDRLSVSKLREHYPELGGCAFVTPDIIDDGERLEKIQDERFDFVISSHFLEHCKNPILALKNAFRVLKKKGILLLAVPDKRRTFDSSRPITTLEHFWQDYEKGGDQSENEHIEEFARVFSTQEEKIRSEIKRLQDTQYSIHYHTWTSESFEAFLKLAEFLQFEIVDRSEDATEFTYVLRKI